MVQTGLYAFVTCCLDFDGDILMYWDDWDLFESAPG